MHPLFWVLAASVVVWGGLFAYLVLTDSRLRRLERRIHLEQRSNSEGGE